MKRLFLLAFLPIFLFSCDKETVVEPSKVPGEVKNYINTHFPANEIIQIIEDKDGLELTYDVTLKDGILLEFNRKKEIIDLFLLGKSNVEISKDLKVNYNYVFKVIKEYKTENTNNIISNKS